MFYKTIIITIIMQHLTRHVLVIRMTNRRRKFYSIILFGLVCVNADDFVEFRVSNTHVVILTSCVSSSVIKVTQNVLSLIFNCSQFVLLCSWLFFMFVCSYACFNGLP